MDSATFETSHGIPTELKRGDRVEVVEAFQSDSDFDGLDWIGRVAGSIYLSKGLQGAVTDIDPEGDALVSFDLPQEKVWQWILKENYSKLRVMSSAQELRRGDRVQVVEPFESNSSLSMTLAKGMVGIVKKVDVQGDASISFVRPKEGWSLFRKPNVRQWVWLQNSGKLKVLSRAAQPERPEIGDRVRIIIENDAHDYSPERDGTGGLTGTIVQVDKSGLLFKVDLGDGMQFHYKEAWLEVRPLPAHEWHSKRRVELLQHPGVKSLLRHCSKRANSDLFIDISIAAGVVSLHFGAAVMLQKHALRGSAFGTALLIFVVAFFVGAQCAFLLQALNHELAHRCERIKARTSLTKPSAEGALQAGSFSVSVAGAALCHMPWAAYYWAYGHERHHRFAGSQFDVDGDAIFWVWQPPVQWGMATRLVWVCIGTVFLPLILVYALTRATIAVGWRRNQEEWLMIFLDIVLTGLAHAAAGPVGAAYLFLSSFFSMGFLCHPLMGFWILQHLCAQDGAQPTVSYYGSQFWNIISINELLHVEHHDLRTVRWWYMPQLRKVAPELYENLHAEHSILSVIWEWLRAESKNAAFDFGCRARNGFEQFDPSPDWDPYHRD